MALNSKPRRINQPIYTSMANSTRPHSPNLQGANVPSWLC
jgi:hypothetical protein